MLTCYTNVNALYHFSADSVDLSNPLTRVEGDALAFK